MNETLFCSGNILGWASTPTQNIVSVIFCFKLFCGCSGRKNVVPMQTLGGKMDALRHTSGCNFLLHRNSICVVRQRVSWHLVLGNQPTVNVAPSAVDVPEWWSAAIINHPTHNYSEHSKLNLFHPKLVKRLILYLPNYPSQRLVALCPTNPNDLIGLKLNSKPITMLT